MWSCKPTPPESRCEWSPAFTAFLMDVPPFEEAPLRAIFIDGPTPNKVSYLAACGMTRDLRESFAIETPVSIARQADSPESLEFPIRANHSIRANRANRFARITPLRCPLIFYFCTVAQREKERG